MSNKKETAVDLMFNSMIGAIPKNQHSVFEQLYQKAKAMEKEQLRNAYYDGTERNRPEYLEK